MPEAETNHAATSQGTARIVTATRGPEGHGQTPSEPPEGASPDSQSPSWSREGVSLCWWVVLQASSPQDTNKASCVSCTPSLTPSVPWPLLIYSYRVLCVTCIYKEMKKLILIMKWFMQFQRLET